MQRDDVVVVVDDDPQVLSLRNAFASLWMAFQPIVSMPRRTVFGYEALMRTADPTLSAPTQVLDAAERLGALDELGRLVRRRACEPIANAPADPHELRPAGA